jgi:ER-bound oxygenase mpaB/B'/Rubber oxygenase, catalytic domain
MTITTAAGWPVRRGQESGIVIQFGEARAKLARWALVTGDPLADAVVTEVRRDGFRVRAALEQGIRAGLKSVPDAPPAVQALLTETERLPAFVDEDLLDRGSAAYFMTPIAAHMVSLSAGGLIRVYQSPSISKALATTGRLIDNTDRRIRETGKWMSTVMLPGSLRPGNPGYIATLHVRMLHARMRYLARSNSFDEIAYGAPINQIDLARTWMDFTVTSLRAEEIMGFCLTSREIRSYYRYWWLLAHLLGIDPRLVEGISSNEQAARVDDLFQAVTGPPEDDAVALTHATIDSIAGILREVRHVPCWLGSRVLQSLARSFHGDAMADELRIPSSAAADVVIAAAVRATRARRAGLRSNPGRCATEQARNILLVRKLLGRAEPALFETHGVENLLPADRDAGVKPG